MNDRIYFTVLIYLHEGKEALFQEYERQAKPIMARYGGRFEQVIKPTTVVGDLPLPDEIHLLSFAAEADFDSYRQDPEAAKIAPLRFESVKKAIFISGHSLAVE
jgi:uncharacterized protein (DUF1330 family)